MHVKKYPGKYFLDSFTDLMHKYFTDFHLDIFTRIKREHSSRNVIDENSIPELFVKSTNALLAVRVIAYF